MDIHKIIAIDSHTHINHNSPYDVPQNEVYTAKLNELHLINKAANIDKMLCSSFASVLSSEDIVHENEYIFEQCQKNDFLYQWVVIDPRIDETFTQFKTMICNDKCVGIKLHPLYHKYSLSDYSDKIFSLAAEYNAKVLIHPEVKNPSDYVCIADKYPNVKFIIAHLGSKDYVDAIANAKHNNIYTDTSGIASSQNNIIEYAVNRVGSENILFGTDTYSAGFQRGRIEYALIPDTDKANILCYNAQKLFNF